MDSPIARYLDELRVALRHDPLLARRVVEEAADHLAEIAARERSHGMSEHDAEMEAVRRFGPASTMTHRFDGFSATLRALVALAGSITVLVAGWLLFVTTFVLPRHDPGHVTMWRGVAFAYLAFAGLSFAALIGGARRPWLRAIVWVLAAGAITWGVVLVRAALWPRDGHGEGYLLLMGVLVAGHGVVALLDGGIGLVIGRRLRSG